MTNTENKLVPHKWQKEIIAWANGETIQFRSGYEEPWADFKGWDAPSWMQIKGYEYRVKPVPTPTYLRSYMYEVDGGQHVSLYSEEGIFLGVWERIR